MTPGIIDRIRGRRTRVREGEGSRGCPECAGRGRCKRCRGQGSLVNKAGGGKVKCYECEGTKRCWLCLGAGRVPADLYEARQEYEKRVKVIAGLARRGHAATVLARAMLDARHALRSGDASAVRRELAKFDSSLPERRATE